jgi:hypothetical protein
VEVEEADVVDDDQSIGKWTVVLARSESPAHPLQAEVPR